MTSGDPAPDELLARTLREFDHASVAAPGDLQRLQAQIVSSAAVLLDRRRQSPAPWWEYAATWSRTVLEMVLATAVAAIVCIVWATRAAAPASTASPRAALPSQALRGNGEANASMSQQLLFALVAPVEQQVLPHRSPTVR